MIDKILYIGREKGCWACTQLKPRLIKIAANHGHEVQVVEVDSEEGENLCEIYGVRNVPMVLFFDGSGDHTKLVGNVADSDIEKMFV